MGIVVNALGATGQTAVVPVTDSGGNKALAMAVVPVGPNGNAISQAGFEYEAVAASATDQVLGATGAIGDYLSHIIIQPATTGAGTVTVKDGTTVIYTFTTGTLGDLRSLIIPFNSICAGAGWKVTTGANVAVLAFGDFT